MVQLPVPLPFLAHGKINIIRQVTEFIYKFSVIFHFHCFLGSQELAEVTLCPCSRGNVEIVRIHHGMGRQHHNGVRL